MDPYLISLISVMSFVLGSNVCIFLMICCCCSSSIMFYITFTRCYFFRRKRVKGSKTVLITGGTTGIGYSLAKLFVEDEYNIIIVSSSEKNLSEAKENLKKIAKESHPISCSIRTIACDFTNIDNVKRLIEAFDEEDLDIDILISNAGFGKVDLYKDHEDETVIGMINCNVTAGCLLVKYFMKKMILKRQGRIMVVSSMTAFSPSPRMSIYASTKAFLRSFSFAVNFELRKYPNVSCTCLSPGIVTTNWHDRAIEKGHIAKFQKMGAQTSDQCAYEGYRGLMKRENEIISGFSNWFLARIGYKFMPNYLLMAGQDHFNKTVED